MPDIINVGKNAQNVTKSDVYNPYTKVVVIVGTEVVDDETIVKQYEAGTDDGLTLEFTCPWGSQDMANKLLAKINPPGGQRLIYKPYTVTSGLLEPAAEIGDAVNTNAVFGGLYVQESTFGHGFFSDYSAPIDEQMNHEYKYESKEERRITRQENDTKVAFKVANDNINAKVSKTGSNETESFSWSLLSDEFGLYSNSKKVFRASESGVEIYGKITAVDGQIGAKYNESTGEWTGGFYIKNKYITSNESKTSYNSDTSGVFIGTTGIGLGTGQFTVSSAGKVTAKNITVSDGITFIDSSGNSSTLNGSKITASSIQGGSGGQLASSPNGIATSNINNSAVSKGKTDHGTEVTNGQTAYNFTQDLTASTAKVEQIRAKNINCTGTLQTTGTLYATNFRFQSQDCEWKKLTINSTDYWFIIHT